MQEDPSAKAPRKGMKETIRHFTPSWFAVCMGTGIVAILLHIFPYGTNNAFLQGLALGFLVLNIVLFIAFFCITLARYIMFPSIWKLMVVHPTQSLFIGTFPMGLVTIISGSAAILYQGRKFGGEPFLWLLWALWWFDVVVSAMTAIGHVHMIFTRQTHTMENMTAAWLLPVVPLIVASSCGGVLSQQLLAISISHALITTVVSISCLIIGLGLALMIITIYMHRLIVHGFPPKGLMVSVLLPLGPLGQGGYAALLLGDNLSRLLPITGYTSLILSSPMSGTMFQLVLFSVAFGLWSFGIWWLLGSAIALADAAAHFTIPFGMPWWGLIFPMGVYAVLTLQLGTELDSTFFRVFGSVLACVVFIVWSVVAYRTVKRAIEGTMFHAPCLDNTTMPTYNTEQTQQP
ncbi:hypothetical protein BOTBODRAFT_60204 [Botryobasidium botryosum FD-172 SS1]|uniref:C4-dicarboxylate transporter/malic acid transport protein n=1 Tax=Botryobasidium botryosum (strain FD-172 SS1) TaxID=930990 RepID=A0A067LUT2_BOTB1|nr:hypothetical protein BOTBODRAFT_60204 [Botryobasidium botryosum FD-172 SS1]